MTRPNRTAGLAAACMLMLAAGGAIADDNISTYTSADPMLKLGDVTFDGGRTLELTVGIGSAAFRHPSLPANVFQTASDRGPNFKCDDGVEMTHLDAEKLCPGTNKTGRIYPVPSYTPSIYTVQLQPNGTFRVLDVLTIKDRSGNPITGLTNPLKHAKTEVPFDARGRRLEQDPNALDVEGLVRLNDGSYWVSEENAPSIVHIAADGRIIKRIVPKGTEQDFAAANYDVEGGLPAILYKRQTNRGIESLAVSPDESALYFMMQSPLANPNSATYKKSSNTCVFKFDRKAEKVVGEYLFIEDDYKTFHADKAKAQNAVRMSEMMATGPDKVIVLERINKTTKLNEIDLAGATNILGSKWDDVATTPSLEATAAKDAGIVPVTKTLRFDTSQWKGIGPKIEGLAKLGDGSIAMINDDDFGIAGARTTIEVVKELKVLKPTDKQAAKN